MNRTDNPDRLRLGYDPSLPCQPHGRFNCGICRGVSIGMLAFQPLGVNRYRNGSKDRPNT